MAGEAPQIVSSTNELAANFTEIRVAHRMNLQQMDQLFGTLSKKTAEYRDLWKKEQSKNIASQAAALQLYEEGATIGPGGFLFFCQRFARFSRFSRFFSFFTIFIVCFALHLFECS